MKQEAFMKLRQLKIGGLLASWSGRLAVFKFQRLAKSKDKESLLSLARKGQEIFNPQDAIKDPIILEFIGLPESHKLVESEIYFE